jgi:hypothetical protein
MTSKGVPTLYQYLIGVPWVLLGIPVFVLGFVCGWFATIFGYGFAVVGKVEDWFMKEQP